MHECLGPGRALCARHRGARCAERLLGEQGAQLWALGTPSTTAWGFPSATQLARSHCMLHGGRPGSELPSGGLGFGGKLTDTPPPDEEDALQGFAHQHRLRSRHCV